MSIGVSFIILGVGILAWQRWVLSVGSRSIKKINPPARRQHYETLLHSSGPKWMFAAVRICGIAMIVVGLVLLLNI